MSICKGFGSTDFQNPFSSILPVTYYSLSSSVSVQSALPTLAYTLRPICNVFILSMIVVSFLWTMGFAIVE